MKRDYKLLLQDIITACEHIQKFVDGIGFEQFKEDEKTSSAVIRKFEIIGEATKSIPEFIKERYSNIAWKDMAGMRDRLIHDYFGVDYLIVWETIEYNIPEIIFSVSQILDDLKREENG